MITPKQLTLDRAVEPPFKQEVQIVVKYTLSLSTNNTREQYLKWAQRKLKAANPFHSQTGAPLEIISLKEEHELYSSD